MVPQHALFEAYSVLTRLPAPLRVTPQIAHAILIHYFGEGRAEIAGVSPERCWDLIGGVAKRGVAGGAAYDAVIADCAFDAGARVLLTWNIRDFLRVAPASLRVAEP